jgi:hypothetical protein
MLWWIVGSVCGLLTVALVAFLVYAVMRDNKRKAFALEHGEQTHGWLVQANSALFEEGVMDLPALVVISPDAETNDDEEFMTELAERIMELKDEDGEVIGETKAERAVSKLMSDESYVEGKKDKLPSELTGGREVYLVHIYVYRDHLPDKRLEGRKIPCAIVWDDDDAMVCTRPVKRKRKRRRDEEDEDED